MSQSYASGDFKKHFEENMKEPGLLKNVFFLLISIVLAALAWAAFRFFGHYTFLVMSIITIVALLARVGRPKFGNKDNPAKTQGKN